MSRVALVTGAASGIGLAAAHRLAASGCSVAAVDVDASALQRLLVAAPDVRAHPCDISDADAVAATVDKVTKTLGPVDHLFHAAGICRIGDAADQPIDDVRALVDVNLFGTIHVCRAVVPAMVKRGSGSLVLVSSMAGWVPSPKFSAYAASKAAATAYAEALYNETRGTGVNVTCVCPTEVDTPLATEVRSVDASAFGGMRPMSVDNFLDHVEAKLAKKHPPLFIFPGVAELDLEAYRSLIIHIVDGLDRRLLFLTSGNRDSARRLRRQGRWYGAVAHQADQGARTRSPGVGNRPAGLRGRMAAPRSDVKGSTRSELVSVRNADQPSVHSLLGSHLERRVDRGRRLRHQFRT